MGKERYNGVEIFLTRMAKSSDDESGVAYYAVETKLPSNKLQEWSNEYFSYSCSCSHDCCGHWFTSSVNVYSLCNVELDDHYLIEVCASRNI